MRAHENGLPRMLSPREAADIAGELTDEDFGASWMAGSLSTPSTEATG